MSRALTPTQANAWLLWPFILELHSCPSGSVILVLPEDPQAGRRHQSNLWSLMSCYPATRRLFSAGSTMLAFSFFPSVFFFSSLNIKATTNTTPQDFSRMTKIHLIQKGSQQEAENLHLLKGAMLSSKTKGILGLCTSLLSRQYNTSLATCSDFSADNSQNVCACGKVPVYTPPAA